MQPPKARIRSRTGFTLIELLAGITVIGVAGTIFVSLFISSLNLAGTGRGYRIAAQLAEEQLANAELRPALFAWPPFDGRAGEYLPVLPADTEEKLGRIELPAAMPTAPRAYRQTDALYSDYTWQLSARLPEEGASHIEVLVEIAWTDTAKGSQRGIRTFTLATLLPRESREGIQ
jgi:prepilin-type N-terminal cleavage/methylation domain-containing protein